MGGIHNQKNYSYPGESFKVSDFLRFGRYAFKLKTLRPSQHVEREVTNWQYICFMHIYGYLAFNNRLFITGKGEFYFKIHNHLYIYMKICGTLNKPIHLFF